MLKKTLVAALAAAAFAIYPMLGAGTSGAIRGATVAHAAGTVPCVNGATSQGDKTIGTTAPGPLTFPTGCYGNAMGQCTGPLVGVYGSSALKTYINNVASDYCISQLNGGTAPGNAIDVEYLSGGDSCPGDQWAANNTDANELGLSDVFASACKVEGLPVTNGTLQDNLAAVNVVNAITTCPGASRPQGAALNGGGSTPCLGSGSGAAGSATFCAPNNLTTNEAANLFTVGGNFKIYGGCDNANSQVQERQNGSGTRVTWCFNVYGPGQDPCNNTADQAPATTTTDMLNDVCGTASAPPLDSSGPAIGYVTRGAVVKDPRVKTPTVLVGCGLVGYQGATGYNQDCNPVVATAGGSTPNVTTNPGDGLPECAGDEQVSSGGYPTWGYEHLVLHRGGNPNNAAAQAFVTFATTTPAEDSTQIQANGFMRLCQMQVRRTLDAGPFIGVSPTC